MRGIFSAATFIALASALVSAAPVKVTERAPGGTLIFTKGADYIHVTSQANPDTDMSVQYGTQNAVISRTNGNNDYASYVSFAIPPMSSIPGATASSTCNFVIRNPNISNGSQTTQLFTLGSEFAEGDYLTFNAHPYYNQYEGAYFVNAVGDSDPIDVNTVPCKFGDTMQFVMRPQHDNDFITWYQNGNEGAFIEIRN